MGEAPEQQLVGQRLFYLLLDQPGQRAGAEALVVAALGQPGAGPVAERDGDGALGQLGLEFAHEFVHHAGHRFGLQRGEIDDGVQAVAELGREQALDLVPVLPFPPAAGEADGRADEIGRTGIGGHDQDGVAEIDLLAVVIGELAVIHHLQQDVEQIGMGLFDLVQQQHDVGVLIDGVGQQPALVEADIAGRGADQPRDRVAFHIFRHVEPHQLHAQGQGEAAGHLGFADAGGAGEEIAADGLFRLAQAGPGQLDGIGQGVDGRILAEHPRLDPGRQLGQLGLVVVRYPLWRDAGHARHHRFHIAHGDGFPALRHRQQHAGGADLVHDVDRLVGQLAIVEIAGGKLHRAGQGGAGVADAVIALIGRLQPLQDFHRVSRRRFGHVDLLEAARQGPVLLEMVAKLLVGGGAYAAQRAGLQRRFQQIGGIHGTAGGGAGADHRVDFVDEHDGAVLGLDLFDHRLQPFLEIAPVAGAGQQRPHIQRVDGAPGQHLRHRAFHDAPRQAFDDGGFADAGIADIERIVLGAPAQHLDGALDLPLAPDQRIDGAPARLVVQIGAIGLERLGPLLGRRLLLLGALGGAGAGFARRPGAAVADIADRVQARHALLLQEIDRVAFALREQGDQDIGSGDLAAPAGLHMGGRAVQGALEAGRGPGLDLAFDHEAGELAVDERLHLLLDLLHIHIAGAHDGHRVVVAGQRQQQMLQRGIFVVALAGEGERVAQRAFQGGREHSVSLQGGLQRMLVAAGIVDHLGDLGLGDIEGIDAAKADTAPMHMQHDAGGVFDALVEEFLQHMDDEHHRRVVVVQQQHLIHGRPGDLGPARHRHARGRGVVTPPLAGHGDGEGGRALVAGSGHWARLAGGDRSPATIADRRCRMKGKRKSPARRHRALRCLGTGRRLATWGAAARPGSSQARGVSAWRPALAASSIQAPASSAPSRTALSNALPA